MKPLAGSLVDAFDTSLMSDVYEGRLRTQTASGHANRVNKGQLVEIFIHGILEGKSHVEIAQQIANLMPENLRTRENLFDLHAFVRSGILQIARLTETPQAALRPNDTFHQVSLAQFVAIAPNIPLATAKEYLTLLNQAMREGGIHSRMQQAAFLAQIAHESWQFTRMEERPLRGRPDFNQYDDMRVLGNSQPGDGKRFRGRGVIQLTGRYNYTRASKALDLDLVNNPDLAADPKYAFKIAVWYWNDHGANAIAESGNFRAVTRLINGAYTNLQDRLSYYHLALRIL